MLTCAWTCVGAGGGSCTAGPVAGDINDPVILPAGGSVTYTASCNISAAASGSLANTATVTGVAGDPNTANNTATDTDTLVPSADLAITKTDGVTDAVPGGSVTYTIVASNAGPSGTAAMVVDPFPASLTCTWTCGGADGGTCTAGPVAGNIADTVILPVGGSVTYTASCDISPSATGSLSNLAVLGVFGDDPDHSNNRGTDINMVVRPADIAITKTVDNNSPAISTNVIFTITATNNGPFDATGVVVKDLLPPGLTYVSDVPSSGSYNTGTGLWTIGNLADGASATLALTATVERAEALVNQAATVGQAEEDPNGSNNTATVRLNGAPLIDIQVAQTVDDDTPAISQTVTFLVTARNAGPATGTLITLTDNLPAGLTHVSSVPSQGTYMSGTGTWDVGTLAAGASATLSVQMTNTLATPVIRTVTRTAAAEDDLVFGNDAASVVLNPVEPQVDLALSKIASQEPVAAGVTYGYFVIATNLGAGPATGVTVTDTLPVGLSLVAAVPSQGSCSGVATVTCDLGSLPEGASAVIELTVTKTVGGTVTNSATVTADQEDPDAANNTIGETTTPVELMHFAVE